MMTTAAATVAVATAVQNAYNHHSNNNNNNSSSNTNNMSNNTNSSSFQQQLPAKMGKGSCCTADDKDVDVDCSNCTGKEKEPQETIQKQSHQEQADRIDHNNNNNSNSIDIDMTLNSSNSNNSSSCLRHNNSSSKNSSCNASREASPAPLPPSDNNINNDVSSSTTTAATTTTVLLRSSPITVPREEEQQELEEKEAILLTSCGDDKGVALYPPAVTKQGGVDHVAFPTSETSDTIGKDNDVDGDEVEVDDDDNDEIATAASSLGGTTMDATGENSIPSIVDEDDAAANMMTITTLPIHGLLVGACFVTLMLWIGLLLAVAFRQIPGLESARIAQMIHNNKVVSRWVVLSNAERDAAAYSFALTLVTTLLLMGPIGVVTYSAATSSSSAAATTTTTAATAHKNPDEQDAPTNDDGTDHKDEVPPKEHDQQQEQQQLPMTRYTSIIFVTLLIQCMALTTHGMMALSWPTALLVDPTTHATVVAVRWCEWVPLTGFMTFLSDAVEMSQEWNSPGGAAAGLVQLNSKHRYHGARTVNRLLLPIFWACLQSYLCLCGLIWFGKPGWWSHIAVASASAVMLIRMQRKYHRMHARMAKHQRQQQQQQQQQQNRNRSPNHKVLTPAIKKTSGVAKSRGDPVPPKLGPFGLATSAVASSSASFAEMEALDSLCFSYQLAAVCTATWLLWVALYMFPIIQYIPQFLTVYTTMADFFFNVVARVVFLKVMIGAHQTIFDESARTRRQLTALRQLMSILWDSSSDVIMISVRNDHKITSMFSPSLTQLLGATVPRCVQDRPSAAFMVETNVIVDCNDPDKDDGDDDDDDDQVDDRSCQEEVLQVAAAYYVDAGDLAGANPAIHGGGSGGSGTSGSGILRQAILTSVSLESLKAQRASSIIHAAWNGKSRRANNDGEHRHNTATDNTSSSTCPSSMDPQDANDPKSSFLLLHPLERCNGDECRCEIKVSHHAANAVVAVVRDVTERHRRFEAEERAHAESLARQRDAAAVNRFTRHEVKNGLLSSIELCDSLRKSLEDMDNFVKSMKARKQVIMQQYEVSHPNASETTKQTLQERADVVLRRYTQELDKTLHEILDTVLAEAMARDVIHEVYLPRLERVDLKLVLRSSGIGVGQEVRFPLILDNEDIPNFRMDPQLLRYIHRNAVSNACKYGKLGGVVTTRVCFDKSINMLRLEVLNEPGSDHEELMHMGDLASEAVFMQGSRLHAYFDKGGKQISAGDGAWIMQKCAKNLGGTCSIRFEPTQTVFAFECPATPLDPPPEESSPDHRPFEVPASTWGIAIDDSKIQRKLMERILNHAGIAKSNCIVLGENEAQMDELEGQLNQLLDQNPTSQFLVLVDENLDFGNSRPEQMVLSGSIVMKNILERLPDHQRQRVLCLVRSANDSASDIALYTKRTHGFFPKAPMRQERVREILAPLWAERFATAAIMGITPFVIEGDEGVVEVEEKPQQ